MGVIVSLTLDDGDQERPHRDNLFKSDYKKVGIACGSHKTEYQMCVMDFAFDFLAFNNQENEEIENENMNKGNINGNIGNNNNNNNNNYSQNTNNSNNNANKNNNYNNSNSKNEPVNTNKQIVQQSQGQNQKPSNSKQIEESITKVKNEKNEKNEQQQMKKLEQNLLNNNNAFNGNKENHTNSQSNNKTNNQSPLVKLSLERDELNHLKDDKNNEDLINAVKLLNLEKKIVSKYVEVTHKIVYTYEDGSTKESIETQNHKFEFSN